MKTGCVEAAKKGGTAKRPFVPLWDEWSFFYIRWQAGCGFNKNAKIVKEEISMAEKLTMDKLVALCKNRGFIFPGSEISGGLANTWDYGPLGVEFKNNIKKAWWQKFVQQSPDNTGLDCAILMNSEVWVASGHVGGFNDPLMDCKACKARFRADKLIEDFTGGEETGDGWSNEQLEAYIAEHDIVCPVCGKKDFTGIRQFNLMFKTHQGVNEDSAAEIYLRPETAQGIFCLLYTSEPHAPPAADCVQ